MDRIDEMNDQPFDELLKSKFGSMSSAPVGNSLVTRVMYEVENADSSSAAQRMWVIGFALLLAMLIFVPSLRGLDVFELLKLADWLVPAIELNALEWIANRLLDSPWAIGSTLGLILVPFAVWFLADC